MPRSKAARQPLGVVDEADERRRIIVVGEGAQQRETDQEVIGRRPRADPEGGLQRVALRCRQTCQAIEERPGELMDRGERRPWITSNPATRRLGAVHCGPADDGGGQRVLAAGFGGGGQPQRLGYRPPAHGRPHHVQ
jgi:hypothetical protein